MDKLPNWLRWTILLPGILIVYFLSILFFLFLYNYYEIMFKQARMLSLILKDTGPVISTIYISSLIAPKHKFVVSVLLTLFVILIQLIQTSRIIFLFTGFTTAIYGFKTDILLSLSAIIFSLITSLGYIKRKYKNK